MPPEYTIRVTLSSLSRILPSRYGALVSEREPAKNESIIFSRNRPVLQFDWH